LNNFSITPKKGVNSKFQTIGDYNLINSHPIIKLYNEKYFVPITFLLFEAVYESPFYWMFKAKNYKNQAAKNRGEVGEEIDEVYLMIITTETYPSLTHQADVMLNKNQNEPFPIVLTIFDLELLIHYLNDPYDFLYYIKQRTSLMDCFKAEEEIAFLGYHLLNKLWKDPKHIIYPITNYYAQLIERNYYPLKAGLKVSDEGDAIKARCKNNKFDQLCDELKSFNKAKITDILFHLFDQSGDAREKIVNAIIKTKQKSLYNRKLLTFSILPDDNYSSRLGITYLSLFLDNAEELIKKLFALCKIRKYKSKGNVWIGFGSLKSSQNMIDWVIFNNQKWEYNKKLEELAKTLFKG